MDDKLYLEPNRKFQIGTLFFIVLCTISPIFIKFILPQITPSLHSSVEEFKEFHSSLKLIMNGTYLVFVICILILAVSSFRSGYLSIKVGLYPPTHTTILPFRTRIYRGRQAVLLGYIAMSFGISIGLLVVIQSFYMIPAINYSFGGY